MACENFSKYYPIAMKFSGTFSYMRARALLILDPIGLTVLAGCGPKVGHIE